MWTKLFQTFRSNRILKRLVEDFGTILDDSRSMYQKILSLLYEGGDVNYAHDFIYETDKRINQAVQDVRRHLVEHLSLTGVVDLPASLIIMSVLKDAERLGDYCKNLYEVAEHLDKETVHTAYWERIKTMHYDVLPMFDRVKEAFAVSDKELAQEQMDLMRKVTSVSDELIDELYTAEITPNQAICYALLTRYCKRVSSHLGNIASSVVVPLPLLDFLDEPRES